MWCVVCLRGGCVLLLRRMYKPVLFSAHHFRGVTIPPKSAALMLEACRKLEDTCTAAKVVHLFLQLHPSIHQPHIITTSFHIWYHPSLPYMAITQYGHHPSLPYMAITHPFHIWPSPIPSIYGYHPSLPYMAITHPFHIWPSPIPPIYGHHSSLPYMAITHPFHIWPSPIPSIYGHHPSLPYMAITHPFHIWPSPIPSIYGHHPSLPYMAITHPFHIWPSPIPSIYGHHPSLPYMAITHPFHIWPSPIPSIYGHHPSLPYMAITHPFHICSHRSGGSWHRSPFLFPSGIPPYMACLVLHGTLSAGLCRGVSRFHLVPAQSHECSYTPPSPGTQGPPDTEVWSGDERGRGGGRGFSYTPPSPGAQGPPDTEVWSGEERGRGGGRGFWRYGLGRRALMINWRLMLDWGRRTKGLEGRSQAFVMGWTMDVATPSR